MSKNMRIFSCRECGYSYTAFPPDDHHPTASLEEPKEASGTVIKVTHDCEKCKTPIVLYWYRPKMDFRVG